MRRTPPSPSPRLAVSFFCLLVLLPLSTLRAGAEESSGKRDDALIVPFDLPQEFRNWLTRVEILITDEERAFFLGLEEDFRRRAFMDEFWKIRDPNEHTTANELKIGWMRRAENALQRYGRLDDARARLLMSNGPPGYFCIDRTREVEIWRYGDEDHPLFVLLFRPAVGFPYQAYQDGWLRQILRKKAADVSIHEMCQPRAAEAVAQQILAFASYPLELQRLLRGPEAPASEWLAAFRARTTEIPAGAPTFSSKLAFDFPGRYQSRTVLQGILSVPPGAVATTSDGFGERRQFLLTGEVVRDDRLFESFRYRFEMTEDREMDGGEMDGGRDAEALALVFQRYLRPGPVRLLLKLEDLNGRRFTRHDLTLDIPRAENAAPAGLEIPRLADTPIYQYLAEANAATARGERSMRLLPPPGVVHTGLVRFSTLTVGEIDQVTFFLDEEPILTKRREPFSVELDLGKMPAIHHLRAAAYLSGEEVAADEIVLNPGGQRFRVRLTEPRADKTYADSLRAVVQAIVPDGEELERVEIFLDETPVATLYQPPFVQPILLGGRRQAYVRAVAYLADGNSNEDLVFVNAPDFVEQVDVQFVELYATVLDRRGRPLRGLGKDAFTVLEDGRRQDLRRFNWVEDLPIHAALLVDISASMESDLESVAEAARTFARTIQPRDRATLISFNDQPEVEVRFTSDVAALESALGNLRASGGTALYDSLVFTLHYFHGVKGQKALLLLSDGEDEASGFAVDQALEFARRAGVTIYAIGLETGDPEDDGTRLDRKAKSVLESFAEETGGRAFLVRNLAELEGIYAEIHEELRSQYFLAYQSSSTKDASEFRRVEVKVESAEDKAEVRTMSGYYP